MLRVLVPVDGSLNSQHGVKHVAREFAKHQDIEIHLLNVQTPFSNYVTRFTTRSIRMDYHQERAKKALDPARQTLDRAGIAYTVHAEVGDKADCIAETARRLWCDHIVMSTSRKSSLARWIRNSVTNQVIARARVPVTIVAGEADSLMDHLGIPAGLGVGLLILGMVVD